jgi:predicted metalloprotease with PDZ domain
MRIPALLPTVFMASVSASALVAQESRITRVGPGTIVAPSRVNWVSEEPRAIIGVSTTNAATSRDTLGVLVSSVRTGSPAEKAGIEEGNRIVSINGVSLKLAAADIGDEQMAGVMSRRLSRELERLRPGDEIDLRVYTGGTTKAIKVKTVAPADLYETYTRRTDDERATLGLNLAVTGSARDTIGVFVMSVEETGAAAKAGIEEGYRIASINGIDLKGRRADDDDYVLRTSNVSRLEREIARAKPGDVLDLRVYYNGQYKNVKVTAGRWSDLPRRNRAMTIMGGDGFMRLDAPRVKIDGMGLGRDIGDEVRRALETARVGINGGFDGFRAFSRVGGRVDW